MKAVSIDPATEVASTGPVGTPKRKTWIARHRIARVADKRASASKTFNAAGVIASAAVEDSEGIDSAVVDLAALAAVGSEVGDEN